MVAKKKKAKKKKIAEPQRNAISLQRAHARAQLIPDSIVQVAGQLNKNGIINKTNSPVGPPSTLWFELFAGDFILVRHIAASRSEDGSLHGTVYGSSVEQIVVVVVEVFNNNTVKVMTADGILGYCSLYGTHYVKVS